MESEAVLRKLLSIAFLLVISTGMPAYAVDYLNCREMLRTKNEFAKKLSANNDAFVKSCGITPEKQITIIEQDKRIIKLRAQIKQAWEKAERDQLVTDEEGIQVRDKRLTLDDIMKMLDKARDIEIRLGWEIAKIAEFLTLDIIRVYLIDCWKTKINKGNFNKEEQKSSFKKTGYSFYDDNGYNWYKKVLRVKEDMRKANCPY